MKRLSTVIAAAGLIACMPQSSTTQTIDRGMVEASQQDLVSFLLSNGYTRVEMVRLPTGHFSIGGSANDISLDLIVDTGASHTVLDVERARRFDLATEDRGRRATGIGLENQRVASGRLENVAIGSVRFETLPVTVIDLTQVNQVLRSFGNPPVDGIVGADLLMSQKAVIDYGSLSLYFKE